MAKKQIVIDAPKHPVVRYRFLDERTVVLDLRGIFSPHSPFNGRLNPTKGQKRIRQGWSACKNPSGALDSVWVGVVSRYFNEYLEKVQAGEGG